MSDIIRTHTFDTAGQHDLDIPDDVSNIWVELEGAAGAGEDSDPGLGGYTEGNIPNGDAAGSTLNIHVGGEGERGSGGYNGGGDATGTDEDGEGGGGASDIRIGGNSLDDRIAVAGGGGGGGRVGTDRHGGDGGGLSGETGSGVNPGEGGTQTEGGSGSTGDGSFGEGGDGSSSGRGAGGGGGGWYGGGGGHSFSSSSTAAGGGSGYIGGLEGATTEVGGGGDGDGSVTVVYERPLDPVEDLAVTDERDTEIDLGWTVVSDGADGQRIYRDTSAGIDTSTASPIADVDSETSAYTDTGLDNGTQFFYLIESYSAQDGSETTAESSEVSGQTGLPAVEGFVLDTSTQDELTVEPQAKLNAGQYRIRWKRSVDSSYPSGNEATVAWEADPLEYTVTPVLDGEQYDVGVRHEAPDATSGWHTAAEVTKLVPASNVTVSIDRSTDTASVTWINESDYEGSIQIWRRRADYSYDDERGELIATVDTTTESYTDEQLFFPDREYSYTIRYVTQYVSAGSVETVTTESAGLAQHAAPPRGWYAEVDHPSGQTRTIAITEGARWRPQLNGLPRVSLPTRRDETWRGEVWEDQPLRVWYDGQRLPIDEVEAVTTEEGQTVLEGRGGLQLRRHVDVEYASRASHEAARDLVEGETDYAANVDDPESEEIFTELMLLAETLGEWQTLLGLDDDQPFKITEDGRLEQTRTSWVDVGGAGDADFEGYEQYEADYSGPSPSNGVGTGIAMDSVDHEATWTFTLEHTIPADAVAAYVRDHTPGDTRPGVEFRIDGTTVATLASSSVDGGVSLSWTDITDGPYGSDPADIGDLEAGEHTISVRITDAADDPYVVDRCTFVDERFDHFMPNSVTTGPGGVNHLEGPELYPVDSVETSDAETAYAVLSADIESEWNDTSGDQAIAVSIDQGDSWIEERNTDSPVIDLDDYGGTIRARLTLSRFGSRDDGTPLEGYEPQSVDAFELVADLADVPVLVNQPFEGDLVDVLNEIADYGDFVWEIRRDGDGYSVEWTRAGQRTGDASIDVTGYEDRRTVEDKTLACEVIGGHQSVSSERFVSDGGYVSLGNADLISGAEYVFDPETNESFERGSDYEIRNRDGEIRVRDSGDMDPETEYAINYEYKPRGRHEHEDWDGDPVTERSVEIPSLTTRRGCEQAALRIVQETSSALTETTVRFAGLDPDQSLVEAINIDALPGDDYLEVRENDFADGEGQARLGDRRSVGDAVSEIRSQINAVARRS